MFYKYFSDIDLNITFFLFWAITSINHYGFKLLILYTGIYRRIRIKSKNSNIEILNFKSFIF